MTHPKIAVIVPTYSVLDYSRRTLLSLYKYTPEAKAVVVDDASPDWNDKWYKDLSGEPIVFRFPRNGGLTRSWNKGLEICLGLDVDFVVCGNNDILFTFGWWRGMSAVLEEPGVKLAGPLSNAPGITAKGLQDIRGYVHNYHLSDSPDYNNKLSGALWSQYGKMRVETPINGFFMMATVSGWDEIRYDKSHVFCPVNTYTSKGKRNPTPLMTCNEDELQGRMAKAKLKSAVALGSFIFHYRSAARGQKKYGKGQDVRMSDPKAPV